MKLRQNWMTDNEYFDGDYPNNLILDDAVRRFETQRDQSLEGRNAIIDGIEERVVLQMHTNMLNQVKYDYKIHCNRDSLIHRGSIVNIDREQGYFVVTGAIGTTFSWEIKAKRLGYENSRLNKPVA